MKSISDLSNMLCETYKFEKDVVMMDLIKYEGLYQTKEIMKNKGYNGFGKQFFYLATGALSDKYKSLKGDEK